MPIVVSDAVDRLVKNRASGQTMPPLSESAPDLSVETAYRIQRALESKLVEGAMPAFELIDFRLSGKLRAPDVIADGVLANGIVLGWPLVPVTGIDLSLEGVVFEQNGERVATATAAEVMGNPLNSLAWLANALGGQGGKLRAGDIVMTGSISKVLRPKAGDSVRASFTRLGSVSCRYV